MEYQNRFDIYYYSGPFLSFRLTAAADLFLLEQDKGKLATKRKL